MRLLLILNDVVIGYAEEYYFLYWFSELGHKDVACLRRRKNGAKKMNRMSKDEVDNDPDDMSDLGIDDIENEL